MSQQSYGRQPVSNLGPSPVVAEPPGQPSAARPGGEARSLAQLRTAVEAKLSDVRDNATVNIHTGEYKNPVRTGYDRAMTEVLELIDNITERPTE